MTPPDASLSRLLMLVEQKQAAITGTMLAHMPVPEAKAVVDLKAVAQDLAALLPVAQQHAEALRDLDANTCLTGRCDKTLHSVADFLDPKEEA